jgi:hypothetical protein
MYDHQSLELIPSASNAQLLSGSRICDSERKIFQGDDIPTLLSCETYMVKKAKISLMKKKQ